jgi:predicted metal-dependent HD superfamily phosphohydrolase
VAFACAHQPFELPVALAAELTAAYAEPQRAYHDASHIAEVLGWFDRVADEIGWHDPATIYAAIVFHDAIYVPGASDNEVRSAAWLRASALPCDLARGAELVELTKRHGEPIETDHDAGLFLDSDMAIIGAEPAAFDRYNAAIAREYAAIPADLFRAGRATFLATVLALPRIFITDYFHARLDAQARANLTRAAAELR